MKQEMQETYGFEAELSSLENAIEVLVGKFVSREDELKKYSHIDILNYDKKKTLQRLTEFADRLQHVEFYKQINDIIEVGLRRYQEKIFY